MATSGQYRREYTRSLNKVLANFVVNNNIHDGKSSNGESISWEDVDNWKLIYDSLG